MTDELLGGCIGAVGAVFGGLVTGAFQLLARSLTRPRLKLDFLGDDANLSQSTYMQNGQEITQKFVRARLRNKGRRVARNCRVFLVGIEEVHPSGTAPTKFQDAMPLAWPESPREYAPHDIPKGVNAYVDVVGVTTNQTRWRFHVKELLGDKQSRELLTTHKGTYRLKLVATADYAKPKEFAINVHYDGEWNSLRAWPG